MSAANIIRAETAWHCWRRAVMGYPANEADDYEPRSSHDYQPNFRTYAMHSILNNAGVADLTAAIKRGNKLMRWRLQHFSDDHATELEHLLKTGALAEPDPSSVGLAMLAHRHWMEMRNPRVAKVLVMYMLRVQMTADEIMDELMQENGMLGASRDEKFAVFVDECVTNWRCECLSVQLKPKAGNCTKKVEI